MSLTTVVYSRVTAIVPLVIGLLAGCAAVAPLPAQPSQMTSLPAPVPSAPITPATGLASPPLMPSPFIVPIAVTPSDQSGAGTVVRFSAFQTPDWGNVLADAACGAQKVHFDGSGFTSRSHLAFWLQGAVQNFFPGQLENGRVPGAVLLGESDVVDGHVTFDRTITPTIGPTEDGGTMLLVGGADYGWVTVADGAFMSYSSLTVPTRPCLTGEISPRLSIQPELICAGSSVTLKGDGFSRGNITLQLWKIYQPAPGEFDSGKSPPQERVLGQIQADAAGHFDFAWTADVSPGGKYLLRALDRGRTRLTTLNLKVCAP